MYCHGPYAHRLSIYSRTHEDILHNLDELQLARHALEKLWWRDKRAKKIPSRMAFFTLGNAPNLCCHFAFLNGRPHIVLVLQRRSCLKDCTPQHFSVINFETLVKISSEYILVEIPILFSHWPQANNECYNISVLQTYNCTKNKPLACFSRTDVRV